MTFLRNNLSPLRPESRCCLWIRVPTGHMETTVANSAIRGLPNWLSTTSTQPSTTGSHDNETGTDGQISTIQPAAV